MKPGKFSAGLPSVKSLNYGVSVCNKKIKQFFSFRNLLCTGEHSRAGFFQ
jgi:hypothetical protein